MSFFEERGKPEPGQKPLGAEKRTNKLNPHMRTSLGIEPGPYGWGSECYYHCVIPAPRSNEIRGCNELLHGIRSC